MTDAQNLPPPTAARDDTTQPTFEEALRAPGEVCYELTLIVSGASIHSTSAISDVRELCDNHLDGRHHLVVVDLSAEPAAGTPVHVIAAPTLVKSSPLPVRRCVGDLSHTEKVLLALGIPASGDAPGSVG